jgi:hypothetical protein
VGCLDGVPRVTTPDLICVLDTVSGDAIGIETLRYGQRVTVISLPTPPILLTRKRIEHLGPRRSATTWTSRRCSREAATTKVQYPARSRPGTLRQRSPRF